MIEELIYHSYKCDGCGRHGPEMDRDKSTLRYPSGWIYILAKWHLCIDCKTILYREVTEYWPCLTQNASKDDNAETVPYVAISHP